MKFRIVNGPEDGDGPEIFFRIFQNHDKLILEGANTREELDVGGGENWILAINEYGELERFKNAENIEGLAVADDGSGRIKLYNPEDEEEGD